MTKGHATLMAPAFHAWLTHTRKVHKAKALAKANVCKHLQRWGAIPCLSRSYAIHGLSEASQDFLFFLYFFFLFCAAGLALLEQESLWWA